MTNEATETQLPTSGGPTCTLIVAFHPTHDERVLLVREVDGYITHWMRNDGVWESLEGHQDDCELLFEALVAAPELLPIMYDPETESDDEPVSPGWEELEIPFGD